MRGGSAWPALELVPLRRAALLVGANYNQDASVSNRASLNKPLSLTRCWSIACVLNPVFAMEKRGAAPRVVRIGSDHRSTAPFRRSQAKNRLQRQASRLPTAVAL